MICFKITNTGLAILFCIALFAAASCNNHNKSYKDWQAYGGSNENIKYSALTEIDTGNVKKLTVAWTYSSSQTSATNTTDMKTNPIVVDGILYGLNPQLKLFALDAATGKEKWVYDPGSVYLCWRGQCLGRIEPG